MEGPVGGVPTPRDLRIITNNTRSRHEVLAELMATTKMEIRPVIICGLGRVGWRVLEYLRATGLPIVVVDTTCASDDPRLGNVRLISGDCRRREVLEQAGVAGARGVLILTSDDLVNISAALMIRRIHADVRVVMRMFNQNLITRLGKAVHNIYALSTSTLTAPLLALTAL